MSTTLLAMSAVPDVCEPSSASSHPTTSANDQTLEQQRVVYASYAKPDGGWGWVVVVAALLCTAIVDGLIFSVPCTIGLLVDGVAIDFRVALFVVALQVFAYLSVGPFVSSFINANSCRCFVVFGAFLSTSGYLLSAAMIAMVPESSWSWAQCALAITLGLCVGGGLGCIYISSILSVSCYFARHRLAATTIALSGSGLGMALIPPLVIKLTSDFDLYNSMFVFAGISVQAVFLGRLIWPLSERPPGCDVHAGLDREKDLFDYIRERVGHRTGNDDNSDQNLDAIRKRQDEVLKARAKRLARLRTESECEAQVLSTRSEDEDSPALSHRRQPLLHAAMSPLRNFINRQVSKQGGSSGNSPRPNRHERSSTNTHGSGASTPTNGIDATAIESAQLQNVHPSLCRQSTVPDPRIAAGLEVRSSRVASEPSYFHTSASVAAAVIAASADVSASELTSLPSFTGAETLSIITDVGRRLDQCGDDVSEFIITFGGNAATANNSGAERQLHQKVIQQPRYKSVSECVTQYGGPLTPTSELPPNSPMINGVAEESLIGQDGDGEADSSIVTQNVTASTMEDDWEHHSASITVNNGNVPHLTNGDVDDKLAVDDSSAGPRNHIYRRQSSSRSSAAAAKAASLRQKSQLKQSNPTASPSGEARTSPDQSTGNVSSKSSSGMTEAAVLEALVGEQLGIANAEIGGDDTTPSIVALDMARITTAGEISPNGNGNGSCYPTTVPTTTPARTPSPRSSNNCSANSYASSEACSTMTSTKLAVFCSSLFVPRLFSSSDFIMLCVGNMAAMLAVFIPLVFFPLRTICLMGLHQAFISPYVSDTLVSLSVQAGRVHASVLLAVVGLTACFSRLGVVVGMELLTGTNPLLVTCCAFAMHSCVVFLGTQTTGLFASAVLIAMFAVATELFVSMTTSIIRRVFLYCDDSSLVNSAYSFITVTRSVSALVGLVFAGFLFWFWDRDGICLKLSYLRPFDVNNCELAFAAPFYFASAAFVVAFLIHVGLFFKMCMNARATSSSIGGLACCRSTSAVAPPPVVVVDRPVSAPNLNGSQNGNSFNGTEKHEAMEMAEHQPNHGRHS